MEEAIRADEQRTREEELVARAVRKLMKMDPGLVERALSEIKAAPEIEELGAAAGVV